MTRPWALPFRHAAVVAALASAGVLMAVPSADAANDWVPVATISATISNTAGRVCVGGGGTDLGCPAYAPSLTTAGDVSVSGNLSAAKFIGDGSGLTGLNASNVSITTGASGSLVFRDGYGSLTASSGLSISSTTGSIGIGAGAPAYLGNNGLYTQGSVYANGNSYANGTFGLGGSNLGMSGNGPSQYLTFLTSNTEAMRIVSSGYVGIGTAYPSSTLHLSGAYPVLTITSDTSTNSVDIRSNNFNFNRANGPAYLANAATGGALVFQVSATSGVIVTPSAAGPAAMGVGIMGPLANLHVSGTAIVTSWTGINLARNAVVPLEVNGNVSASAIYTNSFSLRRPSDGTYTNVLHTNASLSPQTLYLKGMNTGAGSATLILENTNSNALFTLFSSTTNPALAFVGIGISDTQPSATLHVSGSLWVGAISATALTVNGQSVTGGVSTFASLTDVSYSAAGFNVFGPGSLTGANAGVTESTAFGYNALKSASNIGYGNSAFGASALQSNTTGVFNTAFGRTALRGTSTGNYNTAAGASSLLSNSTGTSNAAFGTNTLWNANGSNNAAFGSSAGQSLLSGNNNLLLGFNAGGGMTSGGSNTIIGASVSPYSNTGSNQLAIANAIWGDVGLGSTLQAKIGVNVTSPTASLEVSGTVSATALLINGVAVTGGVSTFASLTDVSYSAAGLNIFGPGSLSGAVNEVTGSTAFGYGALDDPANTGYSNTAIGTAALTHNSSGYYNTALGYYALIGNYTGYNNTAVGVSALNLNSSGYSNTAVGVNALQKTTSGYQNTAVGATAMGNNSTGINNAAFGASALADNRTGRRNAVVGVSALNYGYLVTDTVAIGYFAGYGVNTSTYIDKSVLLGSYAGQGLLTAGSNILIGYNAGGGITTGSSNTVIGTAISPYSNTGNNQLAIANAIWGDVGNGDTLRAKIGINVTSPTTSLEVSGTVSATAFAATGTSQAQINVRTPGSLNVGFLGVDSNGFWQISGTGGVLRGATGPAITWSTGRIFVGSNYTSPMSSTLHVGGNALITSWTGINFSSNNVTPTAPLEVSGTVSATRFVGDGSGLTGITAANDNIVSGSAYVKALQNQGAIVSGSLAISGPLKLAESPPDSCGAGAYGSLKVVNGRPYFCRR